MGHWFRESFTICSEKGVCIISQNILTVCRLVFLLNVINPSVCGSLAKFQESGLATNVYQIGFAAAIAAAFNQVC